MITFQLDLNTPIFRSENQMQPRYKRATYRQTRSFCSTVPIELPERATLHMRRHLEQVHALALHRDCLPVPDAKIAACQAQVLTALAVVAILNSRHYRHNQIAVPVPDWHSRGWD